MLVGENLIAQLRTGDQNAFNEIYQTYYRLVYALCASIVKDDTLAEDLTQESFIKMIETLPTLKRNASFQSFLLAISKNISLNALKKNREIPRENLEEIKASDDPSSPMLEEMHSYLLKEENLVIIYKIVYGFSFTEIKQILHLPLSSTFRLYKTALGKVKKHYLESHV